MNRKSFVILVICLLKTPLLFAQLNPQEQPTDIQIYTVKAGDTLYEIAKKFQTTTELIQKDNELPNDKIFPGTKLKVLKGAFSIRIDKSENTLTLFLNDRPFKDYAVATGANNKTPVGDFKIVTKIENPTWYKEGEVIAPDSPENNLGTRWLGFDLSGYGIHGTREPQSIGTPSSSGCIRMLNQEVEELYSLVPAGTRVTIQD